MRNHLAITLAGLALILATAPLIEAQETGPEALIGRARAVTLSPNFSREEIIQALVDALDAALLIMPQGEISAELKSHIGTAREMLVTGALFEDKVRQNLGLAYKLVSGGQAWAVPEELKAAYREAEIMDRAKKICVATLDGALAEIKAGRQEQAVRALVSYVIFVITPVEA